MAKAAVRINSGIAQWTILDGHWQIQALLDDSDEGITTESCETQYDKLRLVLSPLKPVMTSANNGVDGNAFVTLMSLRNRLFSVWIYECVRVCVRVSVCMGMNRDMREWRDTTYKLEQERVTWLMMQENKWSMKEQDKRKHDIQLPLKQKMDDDEMIKNSLRVEALPTLLSTN